MKTCLIIGGDGRIGRAICKKYTESKSYTVLCPSRQALDIIDVDSIESFFEFYTNRINTFIYAVGTSEELSWEQTTPERLFSTFFSNTAGFLEIARRIEFADNARVVALGSINTILPGTLSQTTSKHALVGMVKSLALELAKNGITVNCVSPGIIKPKSEDITECESLRAIPIKKYTTEEEIADMVYFLGSDINKTITGQNIIIDGGYSLRGVK